MIRTLMMFGVLGSFLLPGLFTGAPFLCGLGYIWVDAAHPQTIVWNKIFNEIPLAQVMGAGAFFGYLILDRRSPPRLNATICLLVLFSIWVTLSTALWAVVPDSAWVKWSWAFKGIAFAAFLPFLFRSRIQIEAYLQILLFSCMVNIIGPGVKTLVKGGGYGDALGFASTNSAFLSEGATLATVSILLVPIILHLRKHTLLLPHTRLYQFGYISLVPISIGAAIGTYERTGLIAMFVLAIYLWVRSKHKMIFSVGLVLVTLLVGWRVSEKWTTQISTIATYTSDDLAMARIEVWKWTLDYVEKHPLGGGFDLYRIDTIDLPHTVNSALDFEAIERDASGNVMRDASGKIVQHGRAFHSIYFEVLGEQGWVGLALFLGIVFSSMQGLRTVVKRSKGIPDLEWCSDLAKTLFGSLLIILCGGVFIGIAFEPFIYYLCTACVCLSEYVRRYLAENYAPAGRMRLAARPPTPATSGPGWLPGRPQVSGVLR